MLEQCHQFLLCGGGSLRGNKLPSPWGVMIDRVRSNTQKPIVRRMDIYELSWATQYDKVKASIVFGIVGISR